MEYGNESNLYGCGLLGLLIYGGYFRFGEVYGGGCD